MLSLSLTRVVKGICSFLKPSVSIRNMLFLYGGQLFSQSPVPKLKIKLYRILRLMTRHDVATGNLHTVAS
jgi:hypothetical protein